MIPSDSCPVCGGEMVKKVVEKLLRCGLQEAVIQAQAEVCLACGERLYSLETVRRFEAIRRRMSPTGAEA